MAKIRLGIMGFGDIGRKLYRLSLEDDLIEVVAISDIGRPEILHYLLVSHTKEAIDVSLEGHYLVSGNGKARMVQGVGPAHVPWDAFGVDFVVDATWRYRMRSELEEHLNSGAKRVILSALPNDDIDRVVIMGVNDHSIRTTDKVISAGSSTTNAAAIMMKTLDDAFGVDYAMMTTIHEYTADQPLRDTAGRDFRRSRSAAENIIPNISPTPKWLQCVLPDFRGRIEGSALNVPVSAGSLLDLTTFLRKPEVTLEDIDKAMYAAAEKQPNIIQVEEDPIVSADVIGNRHSVVYDKQAAMKSKGNMLKTISWYHNSLCLAARIKEMILAYDNIDQKGGVK